VLLKFQRDKLRSNIRKRAATSTVTQRISIENSRRKLEGKIQKFEKRFEAILEQGKKDSTRHSPDEEDALFEEVEGAEDDNDDEDEDEDEDDDDDDDEYRKEDISEEWDGENDVVPEDTSETILDRPDEKVECAMISLPSSFAEDEQHRLGLETFSLQEVELRKGQANDALQGLRLAIGQKTLLYRTKVRHSSNTEGRTRAWDDVRAAQAKIARHARSYERARNALERLGYSDVGIYKKLVPKDLTVPTDSLEENRYNPGVGELSWIWRMGDGNIVDPKSWLAERL
jgi:hypothetical protein